MRKIALTILCLCTVGGSVLANIEVPFAPLAGVYEQTGVEGLRRNSALGLEDSWKLHINWDYVSGEWPYFNAPPISEVRFSTTLPDSGLHTWDRGSTSWLKFYQSGAEDVYVMGIGAPPFVDVGDTFVPMVVYTELYATYNGTSISLEQPVEDPDAEKTVIVRYQVKNETQAPVAIAIYMEWAGLNEEIVTPHIEPVTTTEAQATTIHPWILQDTMSPISAVVRVYQDGEILGQSAPIDFMIDGAGNYVSELHAVEVYKAPSPSIILSGTGMNGTAEGLILQAMVNTSMGYHFVSLGAVGSGSYYNPAVASYTETVELAEGEYPTSVIFELRDSQMNLVASTEASITAPNDNFEYYASGVVNLSGVPDVEPPDPNPEPEPDPENPDPVPPPKPTPPVSDPNPIAMNYEKMTEAMEFALNNQKVSGVADEVKALRSVVTEMGGDGDTSYGNDLDLSDQSAYQGLVNQNKSVVDSMNWGGVLSSGTDRIKAALIRVFTIQLPQVGRANTITFEMPGMLGIDFSDLHIDLERLVYVELLRHALVIALAIWGIRCCMTIFNVTFQ